MSAEGMEGFGTIIDSKIVFWGDQVVEAGRRCSSVSVSAGEMAKSWTTKSFFWPPRVGRMVLRLKVFPGLPWPIFRHKAGYTPLLSRYS